MTYFWLFYLGFSGFNIPYVMYLILHFRSKRNEIEKEMKAMHWSKTVEYMKTGKNDLETSIIIENTINHKFETIENYWKHEKSFPPR